ncbi:MAG TPA: hypothetical protein HPQ00_08375, partial [Magnetococcales bacterium]|nr:hypothetical protein [Magnetococcales bacterium]
MLTSKQKGKRWLAEEALHYLVDGPRLGKELKIALGIQEKKLYEIMKTLQGRGLAAKQASGYWHLTTLGTTAAREGWKIRGGRPGGARPPRRPGWTTRDKAWAALINRGGKGTLLDLAEEMDIRNPGKLHNIGCYFGALEKSGHLTRSGKQDFSGAPTNPGRDVWLLINNTGPIAPMWRTSRQAVYDRNTKAVIDISRPGGSDENDRDSRSLAEKESEAA